MIVWFTPNQTSVLNCGGNLQSRGIVKRKQRLPDGSIYILKIPRFSCKKCGAWHRVLPIDILPYKQYGRDIVEGFASNKLNKHDPHYYDIPSEMTIYRWKKEKVAAKNAATLVEVDNDE